MAHYSVRMSKDKPIEKLKEKDWKEIEQEAVAKMFEILKTHMIGFNMTEEGSNTTIIEYDIVIETPRIYKSKSEKEIVKFKFQD